MKIAAIYSAATVALIAINGFFLDLASAEEIIETQPQKKKAQIYELIKEQKYRCLECHDVDRKVVGPAWREVAARRGGHKWAAELLAFKISTGSLGEYGTVQMPHNEVRPEDVRVIVDWILSLWASNQ